MARPGSFAEQAEDATPHHSDTDHMRKNRWYIPHSMSICDIRLGPSTCSPGMVFAWANEEHGVCFMNKAAPHIRAPFVSQYPCYIVDSFAQTPNGVVSQSRVKLDHENVL